jgi:hypothetical protein
MAEPTLPGPTYVQPEPRLRVKVSDIAWGVFWGLTAWTLIAFIASFFFAILLAAAGSSTT